MFFWVDLVTFPGRHLSMAILAMLFLQGTETRNYDDSKVDLEKFRPIRKSS